jgi:DNA-directed RNA polymerase subunit L
MNSIRRIIISDVKTVGFETSDYSTASLQVIDNTSSLHNEYILHRMSLIPVYFNNINDFDVSNYTFTLKVENTTNDIINVTSRDIVVTNNTTGKKEDTLNFFKPDRITGDNILITRLKPNYGSSGEKIHITGNAVIGNGNNNAIFSPVCVSIYTNTIDDNKLTTAFTNHISKLEKKEGGKLSSSQFEKEKRIFMINEAERYYYTNENDEPYVFDFNIESIGILACGNIVYNACSILEEKVKNIMELLKNYNDDNDMIRIIKGDTIMDSYDIIINNETHTLGYAVQTYIYNHTPKEELIFVGYNNPHPLIKNIVVRISLANTTIENVIKVFINASMKMLDDYKIIKNRIAQEFPNLN